MEEEEGGLVSKENIVLERCVVEILGGPRRRIGKRWSGDGVEMGDLPMRCLYSRNDGIVEVVHFYNSVVPGVETAKHCGR